MADMTHAATAGTVVITGCAGLIGSHLTDSLLQQGHTVVGVDVLVTGQRTNLSDALTSPSFSFVEADVTEPDWIEQIDGCDAVVHLASPASPPHFSLMPLEILRAGSLGTFHSAELALAHGARYLLASTSQVYGDPLVHPQTEDYTGNVSTTGPRSCYDEAKRFAEATVAAYVRSRGLDAGIVRIFNSYGPRMRADDGRVVPNFVTRALRGAPLQIHGDGSQTRSFCYVGDTVLGILAMLQSHAMGPINIGNPQEITVLELAKSVLELTGSSSPLEHLDLPIDDPSRRRPDIGEAHRQLGWQPEVDITDGLMKVIDHFQREMPAQW